MRQGWRWDWTGLALAVIVAGLFAWLNSGESVAVHVGVAVLYQVPVVAIFFVAFLIGMATMFLLGLRHDLHVRRLLREHGFLEPPAPGGRREPPPEPPA